jgi:ribosome-associated toxin RatA of RatAB toxin-antitoxin module
MQSRRHFAPELVAASAGPLVELGVDSAGRPISAVAAWRIAAPVGRVWQVVTALDRYHERVPMITKVRREANNRVTLHLGFRIAFVTAGFAFTAEPVAEPERRFELRWISGEPRNLVIRFELDPHDEGRQTLVHVSIGFDIQSLGWLVKYFLKHHPEIQYGVYSGTAVALLDSIRRAAETEPGGA